MLYTGLLKQAQLCTFTGIKTINDTTHTAALHIKALDSFSVSYRIEYLINWKPEKDQTGIAKLDTVGWVANLAISKMKQGSQGLPFGFWRKKQIVPWSF